MEIDLDGWTLGLDNGQISLSGRIGPAGDYLAAWQDDSDSWAALVDDLTIDLFFDGDIGIAGPEAEVLLRDNDGNIIDQVFFPACGAGPGWL